MNQIEYEHECSRAELLGITPPTWEEFCEQLKNKPPPPTPPEGQDDDLHDIEETVNGESDEVPNQSASLQETQQESEKGTPRKILVGLEDLNGLLASTQLKITKFKSACSSFTNMVKTKSWRAGAGDVADAEPELPNDTAFAPQQTSN